jgi:hypothetical protein
MLSRFSVMITGRSSIHKNLLGGYCSNLKFINSILRESYLAAVQTFQYSYIVVAMKGFDFVSLEDEDFKGG